MIFSGWLTLSFIISTRYMGWGCPLHSWLSTVNLITRARCPNTGNRYEACGMLNRISLPQYSPNYYTVYSRYIAVVYIAELDILQSHVGPQFFGPPISRILQTWRPRARYFSWNCGNSLHPIRERQFFRKICSPRKPLFPFAGVNFSQNQLEPTCQCGLEHMLCDGQPHWAEHWHLHCVAE